MAASIDLPPVIALLLDELKDDFADVGSFGKYLQTSGFAQELQRQAEYSIDKWTYVDDEQGHPHRLAFCPSGVLNPFANVGKCSSPKCRSLMARRFARTVGLYADEIILADPVSSAFAKQSLTSDEAVRRVFSQLGALRQLEPLARAGVIRFASPVRRLCEDCMLTLNRFMTKATAELAGVLIDEVRVRAGADPSYVNFSYDSINEGLVTPHKVPESVASRFGASAGSRRPMQDELDAIKPLVNEDANRFVTNAMLALTTAEHVGGVLAAGHRAEVQCVRTLAGAATKATAIEKMEALQALELPWISGLSPAEVLTLRSEAASALPQFREYLASKIGEAADAGAVASAVGELRESSATVGAELEAVRKGFLARAGLITGGVGLSLVLFAVAPAPAIAVAALAAALAALSGTHSHVVTDVVGEHKLKSMPGYVLLKAKDILKHSDSSNGLSG